MSEPREYGANVPWDFLDGKDDTRVIINQTRDLFGVKAGDLVNLVSHRDGQRRVLPYVVEDVSRHLGPPTSGNSLCLIKKERGVFGNV